jgi:DNA-binding NtrC family response regulator
MLEVYGLASRTAKTDAPVLILGETGAGKEHLAWTVHSDSARAAKPFRAVNCAAIPEKLTESILFGHERGAFTGADRRSAGVFEEAEGGTVFLDELAELSRGAQAALLRVLETKKAYRVGGSKELSFDVRVVAATHCDIEKVVKEGGFREDLLYRLNTVTLEVPPLRERTDEIEPLAQLFLGNACADWGMAPKTLPAETLKALQAYDWPGNVRQLRNVIERASLAAQSSSIAPSDLPATILVARNQPDARMRPPDDASEGLASRLQEYEKRMIEDALARTGGSRPAAAKLLRLPLRTLYRRIRALGISEDPASNLDSDA